MPFNNIFRSQSRLRRHQIDADQVEEPEIHNAEFLGNLGRGEVGGYTQLDMKDGSCQTGAVEVELVVGVELV